MNNTVLLIGKGSAAFILFSKLQEIWPNSNLTTPKVKWWQANPRYELRIQNMHHEDIEALSLSLNQLWPLTPLVKVQVF